MDTKDHKQKLHLTAILNASNTNKFLKTGRKDDIMLL